MAGATASLADEIEYTRLHITPLNPALLSAVIPPSLSNSVRNISHHILETFPEKAFGYVELPQADALKLKKKLNGTILKGTKMKVDEAREMKNSTREEEVLAEDPRPEERRKSDKKRKWSGEVMEGVELRDRKVMRGWTDEKAARRSEKKKSKEKEGKNKKERVKSKYTTGSECLFKTAVPPNIAAKLEKKEKKDKDKRAKVSKEPVLVHEFEKTTKHATFLRSAGTSSTSKRAVEFIEGKGWVDEDGNLVEAVPSRRRPEVLKPTTTQTQEPQNKLRAPVSDMSDSEDSEDEVAKAPVIMENTESDSEDETEDESMNVDSDQAVEKKLQEDSEDDTSEDDNLGEGEKADGPFLHQKAPIPAEQESDTSSSASSSEEENEKLKVDSASSDSESESESEAESIEAKVTTPSTPSRPVSSSSSHPNLSIKIPPPPVMPANTVHPLEALYKRQKPSDSTDPQATPKAVPSFSFFGAADVDEDIEDEVGDKPPMTPFTAADMSYRGLRSAAPTPDTAHPSRFTASSFPWQENNDDLDEHMDDEDNDGGLNETPTGNRFFAAERKDDTAAEGASKDGKADSSDFQKWFWENRGDVNRGWKKRRKAAAKENRQKDNRRRGEQRI